MVAGKEAAASFQYCVCSVREEDGTLLTEWIVSQIGGSRGLILDDRAWSIEFGDFQNRLKAIHAAHELYVDFSELTRISPIALMSILVEVKNFCARTSCRMTLRLERHPKLPRKAWDSHGDCLRLIANHGFISALVPMLDGQITLGRRDHSLASEEKIKPVLDALIGIDTHTGPTCLSARIIPLSKLGTGTDAEIFDLVEGWLKSMTKFGIDAYFEGERELIDDFCHRARVLMTEITHNAYDHSYDADRTDWSQSHFGVVALINTGDKCASGSTLGMSQFKRDKHTSFLEIIFVDTGRGILSDLGQWAQHAKGALKPALIKLQNDPQANVLQELAAHLFRQPLSKNNRNGRTTDTGLQHIGYVLSQQEDHVRLHCDGQWFGAMCPWPEHTAGSPENLKKQHRDKRPTRGTAWHYTLRLDKKTDGQRDPRFNDWKKITSEDVERTLTPSGDRRPWRYFDERFARDSHGLTVWASAHNRHERCVWLPKSVTKQQIHQWIGSINRQCRGRTPETPMTWLIADLSREQASTICHVLLRQRMGTKACPVEIIIVTSDWLIACFTADGARAQHNDALTSHVHQNEAGNIFSLLKQHDSRLFWGGILPEEDGRTPETMATHEYDPTAFIHEKVIWRKNAHDRRSVVLNGYLDLTQALKSHRRTMIAMRALRRTWHLHADHAECVTSDDLVSSLLPREARLSLQSQKKREGSGAKRIAVGSVYVTGSTTDKLHEKGMQSIHLLRHGKIVDDGIYSDYPQHSSRFALSWTQSAYMCDFPSGKLKYERIPGTPYIGRGGGKAIPIRRFDRPSDEVKPFTESFYKQAPKEMYEHFRKLGIAKLGHWSYGKHHDLITINLGLAIDRDTLLRGPITAWLLERLGMYKQASADIVVYPAHPSTEQIILAVREAATKCDPPCVLPTHFVPVHFLSSHAQTAIRIPSPTYDRIRELIEQERERKRLDITKQPLPEKSDDVPPIPIRAILLDDGALTGKVEFELEQLIQNAGATIVHHLGLVNRTGLPLYRQYIIDHYRPTHDYYWRWDVPTLGNARTCPLCHAIEQAKEQSKIVQSRHVSSELEIWSETWLPQSVTSHWWRHGLSPADLPQERKVTFGKEWNKDNAAPRESTGDIVRYRIPHTTTTGLAATIIEIMRTTSYKDAGTKFIEAPWASDALPPRQPERWRRTRIELAVTQILLFFDDLDEGELFRRFELLLCALIEPAVDDDDDDADVRISLERLACLVLLLTPEDQARPLVDCIISRLGQNQQPLPLHVSVMLGILLRKASIRLLMLRELTSKVASPTTKTIADAHLSTAFARSVEKTAIGNRSAIFTLAIALGEDDASAHTGFVRRKISGDLLASPQEVRDHLLFLTKCLREIDQIMLLSNSETKFSPTTHASALEALVKQSEESEKEGASDFDLFSPARQAILATETSLVSAFRREFISRVKDIHEFIYNCISNDEWADQIRKSETRHGSETTSCCQNIRQRWPVDDGGKPRRPVLHVTMDESIASRHVIFPPICKVMVREFLLNVVHSPRAYNDHTGADMKCHLSMANHSILNITMTNRCHAMAGAPAPKASELIVSQRLLDTPVIRGERSGGTTELTITVRLPLIEELAKENPLWATGAFS